MTRRGISVVLALIAGCAGSGIRDRSREVDRLIGVARDNGAMTCAPVELAMAESHNDFAKQELREGNAVPAEREVMVAETNARAAVDKSDRARCVPSAAEPPPPALLDADRDGIPDSVDECPRVAEDKDRFHDDDGCAEDDNDVDGLVDSIDDCPNAAEDRDGHADADGCPDPDNDGDRIADRVDQCPDQTEDVDGIEDDDGCPDCDDDRDQIAECPQPLDKCPKVAGVAPDGCPQKYALIVVTPTKIELKQTVFFDTRRATIKKVSFDLLDEVAQALQDFPTIEVRVEGHTDGQGAEKANRKLSQKRAESVRNYLIRKGVSAARMVAQGFGEDVPIADNGTAEGRSQNRRVEFVITQR